MGASACSKSRWEPSRTRGDCVHRILSWLCGPFVRDLLAARRRRCRECVGADQCLDPAHCCPGPFTRMGSIPALRARRIMLPPRSPRVAPWRRPRSEGGVQPGRGHANRGNGARRRSPDREGPMPWSGSPEWVQTGTPKPKILRRGRQWPPYLMHRIAVAAAPAPSPASTLAHPGARGRRRCAGHARYSACHDKVIFEPVRPMGRASRSEPPLTPALSPL